MRRVARYRGIAFGTFLTLGLAFGAAPIAMAQAAAAAAESEILLHLGSAARSAQMATSPRATLSDAERTAATLARLSAPSGPPQQQLQAWIEQAPVPVTGAPQVLPPPPGSLAVVSNAGAAVQASVPDKAALDALLAMAPPERGQPLATEGLTIGQATLPFLPSQDDFSHDAAEAIVEAFAKPAKGVTADSAATPAAADSTPADPDFDERVGLVMTLYQVDGTEAVVRHYVATEHMKLIIKEVNNHIDISRLREGDKYRLASIAAVAQTELEDKVLMLNARIQAANLNKADLMQLIVAYDSDAQRKLTQMRLKDSGKLDELSGIDVVISEYTILRDFIAHQ